MWVRGSVCEGECVRRRSIFHICFYYMPLLIALLPQVALHSGAQLDPVCGMCAFCGEVENRAEYIFPLFALTYGQ